MNESIKGPDFSKFLFELLDPICDAEPQSLSEYVKELLLNGYQDKDELEQAFHKDLEEFLHENTKPFTTNLVKKLNNLGYFDNKSDQQQDKMDSSSSNSSSDDENNNNNHVRPSRERSRERDDQNSNNRKRNRSFDRDRSNSSSPVRSSSKDRYSRYNNKSNRGGISSSGRGGYDQRDKGSNSSSNNMNKYQRNGVGAPPPPGFRGRKRCKHYDESGHCPRGNSCTFLHTNEPMDMSIYPYHSTDPNKRFKNQYQPNMMLEEHGAPLIPYPPPPQPMNFNFDPSQMAPPNMLYNQQLPSTELTNPNNNNNSINMDGNIPTSFQDNNTFFNQNFNNNNHNNNNNNNGNHFYSNTNEINSLLGISQPPMPMNNNNNNNNNSNNKVHKDKTKTSTTCPSSDATKLVLTDLPIQLNQDDAIREHFQKFGNIVQIEKLSTTKSMIEFSTNQECVKAMKSPEAIMNNRFIKLFWIDSYDVQKKSKFEVNQEKQEKKQNLEKLEKEKKEQHLLKQRELLLLKKLEHQRKLQQQQQQEQKKLELQQITKSHEQSRKELLDLRDQLILKASHAKDDQEKEKIMDEINDLTKKLSDGLKSYTETVNSYLKSKGVVPTTTANTATTTTTAPTSSTTNATAVTTTAVANTIATPNSNNSNMDQLMAQYQSLVTEAKDLGIETSQLTGTKPQPAILSKVAAKPMTTSSKPFVAQKKSQNSSMIIDNRSTTVRIRDPPPEFKNESLVKGLFPDVSVIQPVPSENSIHIKFGKRASAERIFLVANKFKGKEVDLSWVENADQQISPTILPQKPPQHQKLDQMDQDDEEDDEDNEKEKNWKH
ncbi:hypothetical protein DLAC_03947 [Tieghemostelium lacteum]|uniref:C3H1-type domain-containing protein n=1 Tax=Tieghemostelium lacteum TaxID=361077 RepID=A0A151ZRK8_TIELA|nr:hypothetical protein DLAC_03947 [Tieghemostelium lacteum]|eukprot:KYQ96661.1 hypothetical protein DLAC_03947 [Tieghemostelium lacteum]